LNKALFIGYVWPEPDTTAAGNRMLQLLTAFKEKGYQVSFCTTAAKTAYSDDLSELGVLTQSILLNDSSFDIFIKDLGPDVVVFDRFMVEEQFGWRVAENAPKAIRILNTEDLHSLRKVRQEAHKKGEQFHLSSWLKSDMTKRELASIYRSDLSLLVSSYEMELLHTELRIDPDLVYHLPFLLAAIDDGARAGWRPFTSRKDFICIGNGKHAPNIDAINYLKTAIWPLIRRELPFVDLQLYGAYLPQHIKELNQPKKGFYVKGWIDNVDGALQQARINLAPLRFGAGIKGKLTRAMQNGTPSVTTAIGAEGMFSKETSPVVIADGTKAFAEAAVALYQDEERWFELQQKGVEAINTAYSKAGLVPEFFKRLENLQGALAAHRESNFVGGLLQHHSLASTKYLSKWIEAKNRSKT